MEKQKAKKAATKKTEQEFDELDSFLGADVEVEDMPFGSQYAVIQWLNGRPTGQKDTIQQTGGFFMSGDQGIEPPPGFEPFTMMSDEGEEVKGYAAKEITFSPIRFRRCWEVGGNDDENRRQRFSWDDYETAESVGSPRGLTHLLIGIEGAEEPFLLTVKGTSARAMMSMGRDAGVIPRYGTKVVGAAKRIARKKKGKAKPYPLCAFKLTVGPAYKDGKPDYQKVGSGSNTSTIVHPAWSDEPEGMVDEAHIRRLFVGHELFGVYQDLHREADEWASAWDSFGDDDASSSADVPASEQSEAVPGSQHAPF